jgi:hypothetical protein
VDKNLYLPTSKVRFLIVIRDVEITHADDNQNPGSPMSIGGSDTLVIFDPMSHSGQAYVFHLFYLLSLMGSY